MKIKEELLPPHNMEAEEAVLGCVMIDQDSIHEVPHLRGSHFYSTAYGRIFDVMRGMVQDGTPPDFISLPKHLDAAGVTYDIADLVGLTQVVPTSVRMVSYADAVTAAWYRRNVINTTSEVAQMAYDESVPVDELTEAASGALLGISFNKSKGPQSTVTAKEGASELIGEILERYQAGGVETGIPSGFDALDDLLRGFQHGGLYFVAARPGMGKTALLTNIVERVASIGKRVAFFSLEMSNKQVLTRMVAQIAGVTYNDVTEGKLTEAEMNRVSHAAGKVSTFDMVLDDTSGITLSELYAKCKREMAVGGLDMVCLDYIGLMGAEKQQNRTNTVSEFSMGLKRLAKMLGVPFVVASQLSRSLESRQNKRPVLPDLRDSGSLEQDADAVIFIYRDAYYADENLDDDEDDDYMSPDPRIAEINLAKNRYGATGVIELIFTEESGRFESIEVKIGQGL